MADAMRAMLDELMGANRNGDRPDAVISDFRDERLCRQFLCGFCICEQVRIVRAMGGLCDGFAWRKDRPVRMSVTVPLVVVCACVCACACMCVIVPPALGDQFENTKDAPGKCQFTHDEKMKAEYVWCG
jgi:hypothetical protein